MRAWSGRGCGLAIILAVTAGCGVEADRAPERLTHSDQPITHATLLSTLTAKDPAPAAALGAALAFEGDRLVIGAPGVEAAYVFTRTGATWAEEAKLIPSGDGPGSPPTGFGSAVALQGDRVVVGAPRASPGAVQAGRAHVFVRDQGVWVEEAILVTGTPIAGDQLGSSVAISGEDILVGATQNAGFGSGYVSPFHRDGASWVEGQALVPASAGFGDSFGVSAAIDGDAAVIGAYFASGSGFVVAAGAAYVYRRTEGVWVEEARLSGSDAAASALAGRSVAIAGDTALVGAPARVDFEHGTGAVYVFHRGMQGWEQEATLVADDGAALDDLGVSVAIAGDTAVAGSDRFHDGKGQGTAYVFQRSGHTWIRQQRIDPVGATASERAGHAVAVRGQTVIVGSPQGGDEAGRAHVYRVAFANGELCPGPASCESGFCVDGVCCDTACGGGDPSDCQACSTASQARGNGVCMPLEADVTCRAEGGPCGGPQTCDGTSRSCPPSPPASATCGLAGATGGGEGPQGPTSATDGCAVRRPGPAHRGAVGAGWAAILALGLVTRWAGRVRRG